MFLDILLFNDELYLICILLLFIYLIFNNNNFKLNTFTVYISIFINLLYSINILIFIYLDLNNIFNFSNIQDYFLKFFLSFCTFIWFTIHYFIVKDKYLQKEHTEYENTILYLLTTYLLFKLISSQDMLNLVITLESQNLTLCIICAYTIFDKGLNRIEAALKLYITSAASSGFLLLGCSLIYGTTGCINFNDINIQLSLRKIEQIFLFIDTDVNILNIFQNYNFENSIVNNYFFSLNSGKELAIILLIVGILCFFISIAFKIGQVPFHLWMADVYNGGNIILISYLAIFPKIAISYFFLKSIVIYFGNCYILLNLLFISGFLTIIIGIFGALYQNKIKSFIAYSSIANLGYLILLVSFNNILNKNLILTLGILFIVNYGILLLQIFISLFSNIYLVNINKNNLKEIIYLNELSGYWKINKINSLFIIISFLTLIGIPPLIGFLIKFYIVNLFIVNNLIIIAWSFLIFGVISTFYYLKIIKIIIMDKINKNLFLINGNIISKFVQISIMFLQILLFVKPTIFIIFYVILI